MYLNHLDLIKSKSSKILMVKIELSLRARANSSSTSNSQNFVNRHSLEHEYQRQTHELEILEKNR